MKLLSIGVLFIASMCLGCEAQNSTSQASPTSEAVSLEIAEFKIEGMTCASCNLTVQIAAERIGGVREAKASFDTKQAMVSFDPKKTSVSAIGQAITDSGYRATPITDSPR